MCGVHTARQSDLRSLSALITRVNSSLDVGEVLDHAVEVCAELTGCEGALVYLWDDEQERLVIRSAVEGYRHWIGAFSLELGEGLTGWTALSRRPGIITEDALADPRYKHVPELNDTRFQSVLTVPVVGRDDDLVGVLTLHTVAPHEFTDDDLTAAETIASLVAGAVENAKLHEQALRSVKVFRSLARSLAADGRRGARAADAPATRADGPRAARRRPRRRPAPRRAPWTVDRRDMGRGRGRPGRLCRGRDRLAAPARRWAHERSRRGRRPAGAAARCTVAVRSAARPRAQADRASLLLRHPSGDRSVRTISRSSATIANHAAIALEAGRAALAADDRSPGRELLEALRAGERPVALAAELGVRLDEPSVALVAEAVEGPAAAGWATLAAELTQVFPGTLTDARRTFTALVPIRSEQWAALLEEATGRALAAYSSVAGYSDSTGSER